MATIKSEYLEELINLSSVRFEKNLVFLAYDKDNINISATYNGITDEVEFLYAYISDVEINLTFQQEDIIGLHLENSYNNKIELDTDLNKEYFEDISFDVYKDNLNEL